MKKKPTVSVIVPNYNYARYLRTRIESILAQTYQDFELILLDDASTDDSLEILEYYGKCPKVSVCEINKKNTGSPFLQWKKGIDLSQGDYIWIAESDDFADIHFLETAVRLLDENPGAVLCSLGSWFVDENGETLQKEYDRWTRAQRNYKKGYKVFRGSDYVAGNMYWRNYVYNASGVVFRKTGLDLLEESPVFGMRYVGDWLFWTQLALRGDVIEVYKKLNRYRKHSKSVTVEGHRMGLAISEEMDVTRYIETKVKVNGYDRLVRHGSYFKHILRTDAPCSIKQELFDKFAKYWGNGWFAYGVERLNKYLSIFIPLLNRRRMNRCRVGWCPF